MAQSKPAIRGHVVSPGKNAELAFKFSGSPPSLPLDDFGSCYPLQSLISSLEKRGGNKYLLYLPLRLLLSSNEVSFENYEATHTHP